MAYTTINKSTDYFNTKLYSGNATARSITGVGFQPDFTWIKNRSYTHNHVLSDAVRGSNKGLNSDTNNAEVTDSSNGYVTGFVSDGFSISNSDYGWVNNSSSNYASWNWKANGSGSANTDGDINSTVSVNQTAGFSIVKYTGTDVAGATVGHGLGAVPKMIILKRLVDNGYDWVVYHKDKTAGLYLNSSGYNNDSSSNNIWFNGTAPTSSVFSIGTDGRIGDATNFIAYCFAEKTGYSKFGKYTGNGNEDGSFVYTGFKPVFVMVKIIDTQTDNWAMYDNKRNPFNLDTSQRIRANTNTAEVTANGDLDFFSNGFKVHSSDGEINGSGSSYIYMAFGQTLVGSNNIPCTAR
jgi:hypothetical protein